MIDFFCPVHGRSNKMGRDHTYTTSPHFSDFMYGPLVEILARDLN